MSDVAEIEFHEHRLTLEELKSLDPEHVAALTVLCLAADEINIFRRLFLSSRHEKQGSRVIDGAVSAQQMTLLRNWNSKIYEVVYFFEKHRKAKQVKNEALRNWIVAAYDEFETFKKLEGWDITNQIRNQSGHHYSFKEAVKNIPHAATDLDYSFYTHENGGNDRYPLGEAVLFHARLDRRWANAASRDERQKRFDDWLHWNLEVTTWVHQKHAEFARNFIFGSIKFTTIVHNETIPIGLMESAEEAKAPIFRVQVSP